MIRPYELASSAPRSRRIESDLEPNLAFYHLIILAYNLYQAFKEVVYGEVIPVTSYPETLLRKIIDIGAKIITKSREYVLKIPEAIYFALNFESLWARCNNPPQFALA